MQQIDRWAGASCQIMLNPVSRWKPTPTCFSAHFNVTRTFLRGPTLPNEPCRNRVGVISNIPRLPLCGETRRATASRCKCDITLRGKRLLTSSMIPEQRPLCASRGVRRCGPYPRQKRFSSPPTLRGSRISSEIRNRAVCGTSAKSRFPLSAPRKKFDEKSLVSG